MKSLKRVALLITRMSPAASSVLRGIHAFFGGDPGWTFCLSGQEYPAQLQWIKRTFDGIITNSHNESFHRQIHRCQLPSVSVYTSFRRPILQTVAADNHAIGVMAAEHFLERGFRHFGFIGSAAWVDAATERAEGFRARLAKQGRSVDMHWPSAAVNDDQSRAALCRWVAQLPTPVAVLATNDSRGQQVLEACRELEVTVPHELAVLGVDNDIETCNFCWPPLSSIAVSQEKIGYEAAALLKRLMEGCAALKRPMLIPPHGVVTRRSSEALAVDDPIVSQAVRFILEHACDPVGVEDVAREVSYSPRRLQERFGQALERSVHQEIRRVQMDRAKRLMVETSMSLREMAAACGWQNSQQANHIFRQLLGTTPGAYRNQFRSHASP